MSLAEKVKKAGPRYAATAFLGFLTVNAGCGGDKSEVEHPSQLVQPYYVTAFDNSTLLVVPDSSQENVFTFYRDKDNDGYADTYGEGFYMLGLSETIREEALPSRKYLLEDLKRNHSAKGRARF